MIDPVEEIFEFLDNAKFNTDGFEDWSFEKILNDMRDCCADLEECGDSELRMIISDWKEKQ